MTKKIKIYKNSRGVVKVTGVPRGYTWVARKKKEVKPSHRAAIYRFCSERLVYERTRRGFSDRNLAIMLDEYCGKFKTSQTLIYNWENLSQMPSGIYLNALCKIFEVSPEYFIVRAEEKYDYSDEINEIREKIPLRGPRHNVIFDYFASKASKLAGEINSIVKGEG